MDITYKFQLAFWMLLADGSTSDAILSLSIGKFAEWSPLRCHYNHSDVTISAIQITPSGNEGALESSSLMAKESADCGRQTSYY
jgi:hypothetical protein